MDAYDVPSSFTEMSPDFPCSVEVFEKNGYIKVELALAKGKKNIDKRKKIDNKRIKKELRDYN